MKLISTGSKPIGKGVIPLLFHLKGLHLEGFLCVMAQSNTSFTFRSESSLAGMGCGIPEDCLACAT